MQHRFLSITNWYSCIEINGPTFGKISRNIAYFVWGFLSVFLTWRIAQDSDSRTLPDLS